MRAHLCAVWGMTDLPDLSRAVEGFEQACVEAKISPRQALSAGGVDPSLWLRWKGGAVSPTFRSFEAAQAGLQKLSRATAA